MHIGMMFLRVVAPFYPMVSVKLVADGILRGAGRMKAFTATTFADLLLSVFLSVLLAKTALQTTGIWLSWPIGWVISTALSLFFVSGFCAEWGIRSRRQNKGNRPSPPSFAPL